MEEEKLLEVAFKSSAFLDVIKDITNWMIDCGEVNERYNTLLEVYNLLKDKLHKLKENKDEGKVKKETEKINFWDVKKSIHEANKEHANCIQDFL